MHLGPKSPSAAPGLEPAVWQVLEHRLLRNSLRPVAVALSGGGDSLALLLAAASWASRAAARCSDFLATASRVSAAWYAAEACCSSETSWSYRSASAWACVLSPPRAALSVSALAVARASAAAREAARCWAEDS